MLQTINASLLALVFCLSIAQPALAQRLALRGTLTYGALNFAANDTFESALGDSSAPIFTAGGQRLFPNGVFVEVTTGRLEEDGERVIVNSGGQLVNTGQPLVVTVRPIEFTGGWRYPGWSQFAPYAGGGYTACRFQELIGGEVVWTSVPDAIGASGRAASFNETNLGGTTLRVKLTLGQ